MYKLERRCHKNAIARPTLYKKLRYREVSCLAGVLYDISREKIYDG